MSLEDQINTLNIRMSELENSFAQIRLDLKAAGILHDEDYIPPVMTDIPEEKIKSEAAKKADDLDLFG